MLVLIFSGIAYSQQAQKEVYHDIIRKYKSSRVWLPNSVWFGDTLNGTQSGGGGGGSNYRVYVQGQAPILDSVRLIPSTGITMTQSGHGITFSIGIGTHFVNLWIDTLDTYDVRWHGASITYGASVTDSGKWVLNNFTEPGNPSPPRIDSTFANGPQLERYLNPADTYADSAHWHYGSFFWHDCNRVHIRMAGGYLFSSSTWPAGDFDWAEVQVQVLDLVSNTYQNTGYWYEENKTASPVQGVLPEWMPMRSLSPPTSYIFDYFEPGQYGYLLGKPGNDSSIVKFRARTFAHSHTDPIHGPLFLAYCTGVFAWHCYWQDIPPDPTGETHSFSVVDGSFSASGGVVENQIVVGSGAEKVTLGAGNTGYGIQAGTIHASAQLITPQLVLNMGFNPSIFPQSIIWSHPVWVDSANGMFGWTNTSSLVFSNLMTRDFHIPDTSAFDQSTSPTLLTREEFNTRFGTNGNITTDSVHAKDFFVRNPSGVDSVLFSSDTTGNAIFSYRIPSRLDTAVFRDSSMRIMIDIFNQSGGAGGGPVIYEAILPPDSSLPLKARVHFRAFTSQTWEIQLQAYIKNMQTGDSTFTNIGFISGIGWGDQTQDLNMTYYPYNLYRNGHIGYTGTINDYGMKPGQKMQFRLRAIYYGGASGGYFTGGVLYGRPPAWVFAFQDPPPFFYTSDSTSPSKYGLQVWTAQQYTVPAQWIESGRFEKDSLKTGSVFAKAYIASPVISGDNINASQSVSVGRVAQDTIKGSITLVTANGKSAILDAANTRPRKYALPDTSVHDHDSLAVLVTEARLLALTNALKSYAANPADFPPTSPPAFNDEFPGANGTLPDTTTHWAWSPSRGTKTHVSIQNGSAVMTDTGVTGNIRWRILWQTPPAPDTVWSITTRIPMINSTGNFMNVGLVGYNGTNGRLICWGLASSTLTTWDMQVNNYSDISTYNSTPIGFHYVVPFPSMYYRMSKDASRVLHFDMSSDGLIWNELYSVAATTYVENTGKITKIGFGVYASANGIPARLEIPWIRFFWTPTWDSSVDN